MENGVDDPERELSALDATSRRSTPRFRAAFATLGLALPMLAHAACKTESIDLPVKMVGSRAVATVGINGTPVPLTVDSGAFFSILTDAAAAQLGLRSRSEPALRVGGVTGRMDARVTTVDKLQLFKDEFNHVQFVVGGNEPGAGTMGLMGRNILSFTDMEYDLANGVIRFHFPGDGCSNANMAYWAGAAPVTEVELLSDYRSKLPAIRTQVKVNGSEVVALFDTGATTVLSMRAARRAGIAETDMKPAGLFYGVGRGSSKGWTASFDLVEVGGEKLRRNRLFVADIEIESADMLLGVDFFLSHRIYVSKKESKMFFTYNGGPVFALDRREAPGGASAGPDPAAGGLQATTADQLARRGAASAARRDYAGALADLDRACELEPTSAALFAQRGTLHEALKHRDKALQDFDKALSLDPTEADARFRRAALRFASKDRDGAKSDLDALDAALAPQAQMRLPMSRLYQALNQPAQSVVQLNQWLPAHPNEVKRDAALNGRCWARVMLGSELDQALKDCDDAIDGDSKNAAYLDSRGWVYLRRGDSRKAISDFDRSVEIRPLAPSLYGRSIAHGRLGDTARAAADLAAARALQPDVEANMARIGLALGASPGP